MKTDDVLKKMAEIVGKRLIAYKEDFYEYDLDRIADEEPSEFVWMVRDTGTHMMTPPEDGADLGFWRHCYDLFKSHNDWFYHISLNADGSGEVTLSEKRCDEFALRMSGRRAA